MIYVSLYTPSVRMCQWVFTHILSCFPKGHGEYEAKSRSLDFFNTIFDFHSLHLLIENLE